MEPPTSPLRWLTAGLALLLAAPSAPSADLVIGTSAAFRGPSRGLGIELYRGAMAYFEEVNRTGGVQGRKIVLKVYDDGYNPTPAIENTVRLIEKDDVFLLFNYVGTPTVTRTLPLLKRHEDRSALLFFPFTGASPHRQPPYSEFVFNLRASYAQETAELVDQFVRIGRKRIAVFYQIDAYGREGWNGVRTALARHKLSLAGEATYRRGTSFAASMRRQVEVLRRADPDAIVCIGSYAACAAFVRDVRDAGWDVPLANVSFVGSESLLDLLLEAGKASGKDYTRNLINSQVVPSYYRLDLPAVQEYRTLMDRYRPQPPAGLVGDDYEPLPYSYVSFEGFLNAKLLVAILKNVGPDLRRDRLRAAAESVAKIDLGIGVPVTFGKERHQGLDKVWMTGVMKGRFVPFDGWEEWRK